MRLKSFHGATLTDAMRGVREALGENAIIVATREDEGGGVRVTAAIDDVPASADPPGVASFGAETDGSETLEIIAEALTYHNVYPALADKLMAASTQFASDDPLLSLGAAIDTHFKFEPVAAGKPLMFVGPAGAGKTLCTAKFATQATLAKQKATVVSMDCERAGGLEQLAAFTRLLKINLVEIDDWHALRDLLSLQKDPLVFIDSAGRNPFDLREKESAREAIACVGDATLVLPAGLDGAEAVDLALEFRSIGASKLMITRLDTVKRIGSVLRLAYETSMPLSNFTASSKVIEPPMPMNPVVLARHLLRARGSAFGAQENLKTKKSVS
jgi:flagellar biosynthesis protein FlhF